MGAKRLTRDEIARIRDLKLSGLNGVQIAREIGRSEPAVHKILAKMKTSNQAGDPINWKAKYLGAVAKLAEHGLI